MFVSLDHLQNSLLIWTYIFWENRLLFRMNSVWNIAKCFVLCCRCGSLIDLCRGPHVRHTGKVKAMAITKVGSSPRHRKEMFYLTTHSTQFMYGYMASDIWLRTIPIVRKETCCRHIDYSFRLTARVLLYASSHRQDSTYHGFCYTNRGALAGTRNSSMGPLWRIDPTTHRTMSSYHGAPRHK